MRSEDEADTRPVCAVCGSTQIRPNTGGLQGPSARSAYSCKQGHRFDDPDERVVRSGGVRRGLAGELERIGEGRADD